MKNNTRLKLFSPIKIGLLTAVLMLMAFAGFATNVHLHLIDHTGAAITDGTGLAAYHNGNWQTPVATNGSGDVNFTGLTPGTYYFNMKYHGYTQQIGPFTVSGTDYDKIFQTTQVSLNLKNHIGTLITATNGYANYDPATTWQTAASTAGTGSVKVELLPGSGYYFNMKYNDYTQQIGSTSVTTGGGSYMQDIDFQTTLVSLNLKNHVGAPITASSGSANYDPATTWQTATTTGNTGSVKLELLPGPGYYFNMNYHNYTQQIGSTSVNSGGGTQDIDFQTTLVSLNLQHHNGIAPITDGSGTGGYNTGAWHSLGSTDINGTCEIELLPGSGYYFNMNYNNYTQQIGSTSVASGGGTQNVNFRTTLVSVNLLNHLGAPITDLSGVASYNDGAWHTIGNTNANGAASIELLPGGGYYFNMVYSNQIQQIGSMSVNGSPWTQNVNFTTVLATVNLMDCSSGTPTLINNLTPAVVQYNAGSWHNFGNPAGTLTGGTASQELLPGSYYFNMVYNHGTTQQGSLTIDATHPTVNFSTTKVTFSGGTVSYNQGAWFPFTSGMNLLSPGNYYFQVNGGSVISKPISGCTQNFNVAPCSGTPGITATSIVTNGSYFLQAPAGGSYLWSGPAGFSATTQSVVVGTNGTYNVAVTYDYTCAGTPGGTNNYTYSISTINPRTVTVRLQDHLGNGIAGGTVQYYASGVWTTFGAPTLTDANGNVSMTFAPTVSPSSIRVIYHGGNQQWNGVNAALNTVYTATTTCVSENLIDHTGAPITDGAINDAGYYAGGWVYGSTGTTGSVKVEFLPGTYSFSMSYHTFTQQQSSVPVSGATQNIDFQTTRVSVNIKNCSGALLSSASVDYDGGAAWTMGVSASGGSALLELLPGTYSFAMHYNNGRQQISHAVGTTSPYNIDFNTQTVTFSNPSGGTILYYQSAWNTFAPTGMELLPGAYTFRVNGGSNTPITVNNVSGCAPQNYYVAPCAPSLVITSSSVDAACNGAYTLTAPAGAKSYLWSGAGTGTTQSITAGATGVYSVTVSYDYSCTGVSLAPGGVFTYSTSVTATTNTVTLRLVNHLGAGIPGGAVSYYDGSWHTFGPGTTDASGNACMSFPDGSSRIFSISYNGGTDQFPSTAAAGNPVLVAQTTLVSAHLMDHNGNGLSAGTAQYYSGTWFPIGTTDGSGNASAELLPGSYPFLMGYNYASEQISYTINAGDINHTQEVDFSTTLVNARLQDHAGDGLSGGVAQYYTGSWHPIGTTDANGNATIELLPNSYPFNMAYNNTSEQLSYTIGAGPTQCAFFTTSTVTASLTDHVGNGIDGGVAQYYNGTWNALGTTGGESGTAPSIELLPGSYPFVMTYNNGSQQLTFNVTGDSYNAAFQTSTVTASLKDHLGNGLIGGVAQYYNGSWYSIGTTAADGTTSIELMSGSYPFAMTYNNGTQQITYSVSGATTSAAFQTSTVTASLKDHLGNGLSGGVAQYYNGAWYPIGTTAGVEGTTSIELMPGSYPFAMTYNNGTQQITYSISGGTSSAPFQTTTVTASLLNHGGGGLSGGVAQYYNGAWYPMGTTGFDGTTSIELMSGSYPFAMSYHNATQQISYSVSGDNSPATFQTALVTINVKNAGDNVEGATVNYYSGNWYAFDNTTDGDGNSSMEMLPVSLIYGASKAGLGSAPQSPGYTDAATTAPTHYLVISSGGRHAAPGAATTVASTQFGIFPNPAADKITIQYSSVNNAQATVQVTDIAGKVMMNQTFESVSGANAHDLDMSSLPSGMYMIMFSNEGNNEVRKINVLH